MDRGYSFPGANFTPSRGQRSLQGANIILPPGCFQQSGADFYWYNIPKRGKIFQMTTKLPNAYKIYPMVVKYSK
jgi:hypothetical protein